MALVIALSSKVVLVQKLIPGRFRCCIPVTKKEIRSWYLLMVLKPWTIPMRNKLAASGRVTIKHKHVQSDSNNLWKYTFAND